MRNRMGGAAMITAATFLEEITAISKSTLIRAKKRQEQLRQ